MAAGTGAPPADLGRVAARVHGDHVIDASGESALLLSCSPSVRSLSRGAGLFVRVRRLPDAAGESRIHFDAKPKVPLLANARRGVIEVEREIRVVGARG